MMTNEELDARVAEKVMGWTWGKSPDPLVNGNAWSEPRPDDPMRRWQVASGGWSPSTDISAAWQVVEKMRQGGFAHDLHTPNSTIGEHKSSFWRWAPSGGRWQEKRAMDKSAPRAISLAALSAIEAKGGKETKANG